MIRVMGFAVACLGFIALVMLTVWIMGGFDGAELGFHGWVAMILGMTVTSALGVALMALVFHSDRSGQDDSAGRGRYELTP
jgi:hypothetical protein